MSTPWLSVLVPVYNVEAWLPACIDSLRSQVDEGVEVVLLDDASTDASGQIAQRYAQEIPQRVRLLTHPRNRGLSAARNSLLQASQGEYVWFVDSDDVMLPGAIQSVRAAIRTHAPDVVFCDFAVLRERERLKHRLRGERHRATFRANGRGRIDGRSAIIAGVLGRGQLHAWSKVARRALWLQAPFPEGRYFEDIAGTAGLLAVCSSAAHVAQPCIGYRQRSGSILAGMDGRKLQDLLQSLQELHARLASLPDLSVQAADALDLYCLKRLVTVLRRGESVTDFDARAQVAAAVRQMYPRGLPQALARLPGVRGVLDALRWQQATWALRRLHA